MKRSGLKINFFMTLLSALYVFQLYIYFVVCGIECIISNGNNWRKKERCEYRYIFEYFKNEHKGRALSIQRAVMNYD